MNPPQGVDSAIRMVDTALANCLFAVRYSFHIGLGASPGSLAFNWDMILDIPLMADWLYIQQKRQVLIDQRLIEANWKRFSHDYHVGDEVLKLVPTPDKLEPKAVGPFLIETVHTNGTVTIRLDNNSIERLSLLRRIKPYRRWYGEFLPYLIRFLSILFITIILSGEFSFYILKFLSIVILNTLLIFVDIPWSRGRMTHITVIS
jgi:hypothetical protein